MTIRAIVISPDDLLLADMRDAAGQTAGALNLIRRIPYYPSPDELERILRTQAPDLILIDAADASSVRGLALLAERVSPGISLVAIARERTPERLLPCLQAGIHDFLVAPFDRRSVDDTLRRVARHLQDRPAHHWHSQSVFGFLSAKPGSGATTLAVHLAMALARAADCRPVHFDLDSHTSYLDFMLQLKKRYGILEASSFASELDETIWERLVANVHGVDYIGMGETLSASHLSIESIGHFLDYARRQYDFVSLDLPSHFDEHTLSLLYRCSTIFLVCTPEVASLHMARRRLSLLENEGLLSRVRVVVNRVTPHSERIASLPELLRHDVFATVANSYMPLQQAIENGRPADLHTPFGESIERLAARCLGQTPKKPSWKLPQLLRALLPGFAARDQKSEPALTGGRLLLPPGPAVPAPEETAILRRSYMH